MTRKGAVAVLFAAAVAAMGQRVATTISSRQVATKERPVITGSNLTEVATSRYHFMTNVPPGVASRPDVDTIVADAFLSGFSNAVVAAVESGGGMRFSVTNYYVFAPGATVSVDNVVLRPPAPGELRDLGVLDAGNVYASGLKVDGLVATNLDAKVTTSVGTIAADSLTVSGKLTAPSLTVSALAATSISTPVFDPSTNVVTVYEELYRSSTYQQSRAESSVSSSTVPPLKYEDAVFSDSASVVLGTQMVPTTNLWPVVYEDWTTNWYPTVYYTNALGITTNIAWVSTVTNQPGDVEEVYTNFFSKAGSDYLFASSMFIFTNGLGVVSTNLPYYVVYETYDLPAYTNIVEIPVYTYTNQTVTWTNPTPTLIADTGPIGVCTTSMVLRVFPPGVLQTNAAGRVYIREPAAIRPAGSGTQASPFVMTRPENFRWIRENHRPGGAIGRDGGYDGHAYTYSSFIGTYSDFWSMAAPAEWAATNVASYETWCVQDNDIDMTDTYLWSSAQWPQGEFVGGFGGISGAGTITYFTNVASVVSSGVLVPYSAAEASQTNLVLNSNRDLVGSKYARKQWPNRRFVHRLHYDGQGHSLSGVWVGLNPMARLQSRGLLGDIVAFPVVSNLVISGHIEGSWPKSAGSGSSTSSGAAVGGLFGRVIVAMTPDPPTMNAMTMTNRYVFWKGLKDYGLQTRVDNCVVFADIDIDLEDPVGDTNYYMDAYAQNVVIGGLFGSEANYGTRPEAMRTMGFRVATTCSSVVGRHDIINGTRGGWINNNRLFGRSTYWDSRWGISTSTDRGQYTFFGAGGQYEDLVLFMKKKVSLNASLTQGLSSLSTDSETVWSRSPVNITDGVEEQDGRYNSLLRRYVSQMTSHSTARGYPTTNEFDAAVPVSGRIGYYGGIRVTQPVGGTVAGGSLRVSSYGTVTLVGPHGVSWPREDTGSNPTYVPYRVLSGFRGVVGYDYVDVARDRSYMYTYDTFSLDGMDFRFAIGPWKFQEWYNGVSNSVVVNAAALRDEWIPEYAAYPSFSRDVVDRNSYGGVSIAPRYAMTKAYVVEPANEVADTPYTHGSDNPYPSYYDDDGWTRSGELDGWYPVPKAAAGVTFTETTTAVTNQTRLAVSLPDDLEVSCTTNEVVSSYVRHASLAYTNRYAVGATYLTPTSCLLTVVSQVYERSSTTTEVTTNQVTSTVTNRLHTYTGATTIDAALYSSGGVTASGNVFRVSAGALDPHDIDDASGPVGNDLGTIRVAPGYSAAIVLAPGLSYSDGSLLITSNATPVNFEWWPDAVSTNDLVVQHVSGATTNVLDTQFRYCTTHVGDRVLFTAPAAGFVIIRPGHPTDGLVAAGSLVPPDVRYLCTNGLTQTVATPTAWYKFDGDYTNSASDALHGVKSSTAGGVTFTNGVHGQAVHFPDKGLSYGSGKGIEVYCSGTDFGGQEITVSLWAHRDRFVSGSGGLVTYWSSSTRSSWYLTDDTTRTSDRFTCSIYEGSKAVKYFPDTGTLLDNTWTHIAMVFDRGYLLLYVNGVLDSFRSAGIDRLPVLLGSYNVLRIGSLISSQLVGAIDDVRIFKSALRSDAIADTMTEGDAYVRGYPVSNAVFQVSFVSAPLGAPYMTPLASTYWTRQDFHYVANLPGGIRGDKAYIDGLNMAYPATLRVDIENTNGANYDDAAFFGSVRTYCNYSDPAYLGLDGYAPPRTYRTSTTRGYAEYDIIATQLVILQSRGELGASTTVTLLPKEWPYD